MTFIKRWGPAAALAAAAASWYFVSGVRLAPAAGWLAPAGMLFWFRSRRPGVGYGVGVVAAAVPMYLAWREALGAILPPALYAVLIVAFAALYLLPYLADRLVACRTPGFAATLVFPTAVVALEYVVSLVSPFGTWNSLGYTQYGVLSLMQLGAATGLAGISFVVAWFGAVVVWAGGRSWRKERCDGVWVYAVVVAAIFLGGGVRLALAPRSPAVRVAGITPRPFYLASRPDLAEALGRGDTFTAEEKATARKDAGRIVDDLFARTRREARAGARIVVWGEAAAQVLKDDERELLARARATAAEEGIYLAAAWAALSPGRDKPVENKVALISPRGQILYEYAKTKPVPGFEAAVTSRGDGRVPVAASPYGRLGAAICYDMDFPGLVRNRGGADVMLVPAHDWWGLHDIHGRLAAFRAVENGYAVFRPDGDGHSLAVDRWGRVLGVADYFGTADAVLVAYVPMRGGKTPYAIIGDLFAWLATASLLGFVVRALITARRRNDHR